MTLRQFLVSHRTGEINVVESGRPFHGPHVWIRQQASSPPAQVELSVLDAQAVMVALATFIDEAMAGDLTRPAPAELVGRWVAVPRAELQGLLDRLVDLQEQIEGLTDLSPDPDLVSAVYGRHELREPKQSVPDAGETGRTMKDDEHDGSE